MTIKMPRKWVEDASGCAKRATEHGFATVTRTDIFRSALRKGLDAIIEEQRQKEKRREK